MTTLAKQAIALTLTAALTGCAQMKDKLQATGDNLTGAWDMAAGVDENASPKEKKCHEMASDGRFVNTAIDTAVGAAGGAAIGGITSGSALGGAGVGALLGAGYAAISEGGAYKKAFNECMHDYKKWDNEYTDYQAWKAQKNGGQPRSMEYNHD